MIRVPVEPIPQRTKSLPFIVIVVSIGIFISVLPTWLILRLFTYKITIFALTGLFVRQLVGVVLLNISWHCAGLQRYVLLGCSSLCIGGFVGGGVYLIAALFEAP